MAVAPVLGIDTCAIDDNGEHTYSCMSFGSSIDRGIVQRALQDAAVQQFTHAGRLLTDQAGDPQHHALPCPTRLACRAIAAWRNTNALQVCSALLCGD